MHEDLNKALLYKFTPIEGGSIWIVRISAVIKNLSFSQLNANASGKSLERRNQLACADWLVKEIHGPGVSIVRDHHGAPSLTGVQSYISISHTGDYMAVYLHPEKTCAIDIEIRGRDVERMSRRFIHETEDLLLKPLVEEHMLQIWSVKECLFKVIPVQKVLFREHLIITSLSRTQEGWRQTCAVNHPDLKRTYSVVSRIFEPLIISYTVTDTDLN